MGAEVSVLPKFYLNFSKLDMTVTIGMKDENKYESESFQPNTINNDSLFGLKESIIKACVIKNELQEKFNETNNKKNSALLVMIITYLFIFGIFIKRFRENYKNSKAEVEAAETVYNSFKLDIDFNMDDPMLNDYIALKNGFEKLTTSKKIWNITSQQFIDRIKERSYSDTKIRKTSVNFSSSTLEYINTKYRAFKFQIANDCNLYIYPGFVIMTMFDSSFKIIDFRDVELDYSEQRFVEFDPVPSDTKVIDHTWQYVNKDGSPDKRYNHNPQIPIVMYCELVLKSSKDLYQSFHVSNVKVAKEFCKIFDQYKDLLIKMKWDKGVKEKRYY